MSLKIWLKRKILRHFSIKKNLLLFLLIVCIWYFGILKIWFTKTKDSKPEVEQIYDDRDILSTFTDFDEEIYDHKIVHFDLKGAAPKPAFFKQLLRIISKNGATGILIEYEDMFPFENELKDAKNDEAYTKEELEGILGLAKQLNLTIIPLIQSFGHLEWILKLPEYRQYRDHDVNSGVVCISNQEAVKTVVEAAFTEILQFHQKFDVQIVHIGGDEAFEYGQCFPTSKKSEELAVNHLANIAKFVYKTLESNSTRVLIWNDMVDPLWYQNSSSIQTLKELVELVVWDYGDLNRYESYYWEEKSEQGKLPIWGASAFKGADGANKIFVDLKKRQFNNLRWAEVKNESIKSMKFGGLILTGWQRYDHFSTFCEILPMAIPSLIVNLNIARGFNASEAVEQAMLALNCNLDDLEDENPFRRCNSRIAQIYVWGSQRLKSFLEEDWPELLNSHEMNGWFRHYNRKFTFSNYHYLKALIPRFHFVKEQIISLKKETEKKLGTVLIGTAPKEFAFDVFGPIIQQLNSMITEAESIIEIRSFKKRPFEFDDSIFSLEESSWWW